MKKGFRITGIILGVILLLNVFKIQAIAHDDALWFMAICVEAEAGNQDILGKRLVVDVIFNRVDSPKFPNDIKAVIMQKNQFSAYSDGSMERITEPSEETLEAIEMELEHRIDSKLLYFRTSDYHSFCTPAYKHGDHYFGY